MTEPAPRARLDKWLWAARFFKTRALAAEAVGGGRVHVDGQRAKPGKEIRIGSRVTVQRDGLEWHVEVRALPAQRRPAAEAAMAYLETEDSRLHREQVLAERRDLAAAAPHPPPTRPTKRDRRLIHRLKDAGA
jgi:ribosome-associated heat shock protein Hsp15